MNLRYARYLYFAYYSIILDFAYYFQSLYYNECVFRYLLWFYFQIIIKQKFLNIYFFSVSSEFLYRELGTNLIRSASIKNRNIPQIVLSRL